MEQDDVVLEGNLMAQLPVMFGAGRNALGKGVRHERSKPARYLVTRQRARQIREPLGGQRKFLTNQ